MYEEVLNLSQAKSTDKIDWKKVFEDASVYRQIYKQEIIAAVMEAGDDENDGKRVMYVEDQLIVSSIANTSATTKTSAKTASTDS